jgi:predicted membrane channel-forming protein YqfA (hemolysin III family)
MARKDSGDLDRELIELLNELRVALPGVQVLFAFLLAVPFSQRFGRVTDFQKDMYFFTLLTTAAASILLIAPSSYHRLRWRQHDKERLLRVSNALALGGTIFLAAAMTAAVLLITDVLFSRGYAILAAAVAGAGFAVFWYGLAGWAWFADRRNGRSRGSS